MGYQDLNGQYRRLRSELDAAYSGPVWNSSRIDQIAEQMLEVERALASVEQGARRGAEWTDASASGSASAS